MLLRLALLADQVGCLTCAVPRRAFGAQWPSHAVTAQECGDVDGEAAVTLRDNGSFAPEDICTHPLGGQYVTDSVEIVLRMSVCLFLVAFIRLMLLIILLGLLFDSS